MFVSLAGAEVLLRVFQDVLPARHETAVEGRAVVIHSKVNNWGGGYGRGRDGGKARIRAGRRARQRAEEEVGAPVGAGSATPGSDAQRRVAWTTGEASSSG
jgi:hypothetical protein